MSGKTPTLYDTKKTTIWFTIASLILLWGLVMMIFQDSNRDWKEWQRKFMEYNKQQAQEELERAQKAVDEEKLQELRANLNNAKAALQENSGRMDAVQKELAQLEVEHIKIKTKLDTLKQFQDSDRYFFEEYRLHGEEEKAKEYQQRMDKRADEIVATELQEEKLSGLKEGKMAEIKDFTQEFKTIEKEIDRMHEDVERLQGKISKSTYGWEDHILNAPMLDFMNPTLRIQQIVVENIHDDYYFTKVEKVDRCTTCHLGIDQRGFEDAPQPFTTHPNLDLYLAADSPHPMETIGCTVCHGGNGHSVNFVTASHTPGNEEQAAEWKKKYDWHPTKHWADKMLPMNHVEASCAKCHQGVVDIPEAEKLNQGRELARTYGCFTCHKVEGFENMWKPGPSLEHVQSKLTEDWIIRWLHNPKEFRPSTKMPRIFHLKNTMDEETVEIENAAIAGIATYLMKNSEPLSLANPEIQGDPEKGRRLVEETGCLGCHTVGSFNANDHGPELTGLGSKVKPSWLFDWIKNPQHYYPETRMPDFRLTDEEAAHIVSFLLQSRNEKFESIRLPLVKPEAVERLALGFLTGNMRHEDAQQKLGQMSDNEKLIYVGEKMISRQGCYACHDIKGFEDAKPIGTELTHEGSKEIDKLDFGFVDIPRTREAWFFKKLKEPRVFDLGKIKSYYDKLRMPQFDFTDEQAEALVTFLLSLQEVEIPMEMRDLLTQSEVKIEEGRFLINKLNCQGCHTMDGEIGAVRAIIEDSGLAPPVLEGEGSKVQELWLYEFLKSPVTIRPWLTYRMPTFGFHHEELITLIHYFNLMSGIETSFAMNKMPELTSKSVDAGRELFKAFQCIKCHQAEVPAGLSASFLAPNLVMAKERLRPDWMVDWLRDPQAIQEGTMMPTFFVDGQSPMPDVLDGDAEAQIRAIRDYMLVFTPEEAARITQPQSAPAAN